MNIFSGRKLEKQKKLIEQIIMKNYNQYYRMAYSYVHNESDAYDIVQNGACKAIQSSDSLKNNDYAETWIYRIMINECFKLLKQSKVIPYENVDENISEKPYTNDEDIKIDLHNALNQLSDKDKAVIILKYFEDKKLDEIALILDENVNTIKSRLYRSMNKLRKILTYEESQ